MLFKVYDSRWQMTPAALLLLQEVTTNFMWSAALQSRFSPSTSYSIHPHWSWFLAKVSMTCIYDTPTVQFSAQHVCIWCIPAIITHCFPITSMKNLHSSRTGGVTVYQPDTDNKNTSCFYSHIFVYFTITLFQQEPIVLEKTTLLQ